MGEVDRSIGCKEGEREGGSSWTLRPRSRQHRLQRPEKPRRGKCDLARWDKVLREEREEKAVQILQKGIAF